jgi:hypothetical protein
MDGWIDGLKLFSRPGPTKDCRVSQEEVMNHRTGEGVPWIEQDGMKLLTRPGHIPHKKKNML